MPAPRRASVVFIFVTLLLEVLGFGLLIPVAPKLVQGLLHGGTGGTDVEAAPYVGGLMAIYAVMQFVCAPTLGALSDRFGRRPVLLWSLFGSGLDYFAMAFAPSLWILYVTRAINGISGASMTVANAYIADVTPPQKRAAAYGMVGAAFGLGFILGPLMGGLLAEEKLVIPLVNVTYHGDLHYPFYAAGALSLCNWLYGFFILPESLPKERRARVSIARMNPLVVFEGLGKYPLVLGLAGSLFMMNLAMFGLHTTWVLYTEHRYHWSKIDVGWSLALVGLGAAVVQGGLARKLIPILGGRDPARGSNMLGEKRAVLLGAVIATLAYAGYGLATHGWMIYVIIVVAALGGIAQPAVQALITRSVLPTEQGRVQGALTGLTSIAQIFGGVIGTMTFAFFAADPKTPAAFFGLLKLPAPPFQLPGASFLLGAILCAIGGVIAWRVLSRAVVGPAVAEKANAGEPGLAANRAE